MCLPSNKAHLYGTTLEKKCSKKTKISNYLVSFAQWYPMYMICRELDSCTMLSNLELTTLYIVIVQMPFGIMCPNDLSFYIYTQGEEIHRLFLPCQYSGV